MENSFKQQLSDLVEGIFREYVSPGLHICDIATGGGKSYTIGKLTCEFYPQTFDRIIILCVQNKLVNGMMREIDHFITSDASLIRPEDILVVEKNTEVIAKAIMNGHFKALLAEMEHQVGELQNKYGPQSPLKSGCDRVKSAFEALSGFMRLRQDDAKNDFLLSQIEDCERKLRREVHAFFGAFKKCLESDRNISMATLEMMLKYFPSLNKVFPQVEIKKKRVLLMTVHKAMYGIDPILAERLALTDLVDNKRKTLVLFDESDQAACAMRGTIIEQAINNNGGNNRFSKGYTGFLQYKKLIDSPEAISKDYYGPILENALKRSKTVSDANWKRRFGDMIPFNNIFLDESEDLESYRRGVFFSGPAVRLNISRRGDRTRTYVCYAEGDRHFTLVHAEEEKPLKQRFRLVIPLERFLSLVVGNTAFIKSQLRDVALDALKQSKEKFEKMTNEIAANTSKISHFLGYPTMEREIHTLLSRFEVSSQNQFELQMLEFMTNRKNLPAGENNSVKVPDYSVYSQGVQFYQEEVDEYDNQHRVRLSCREITTTPEKMLIDLVMGGKTSVVLCSATSSSRSVVSNFDMAYLKLTLRDKMRFLPADVRKIFDELVEKTYPQDHRVEPVAIENYEYQDKRERALVLPDKYRQMFSADALNGGLVDRWFKLTLRRLKGNAKSLDDVRFQLCRLFQFIEVYHWFICHDEVRSMLFFQNRTGNHDRQQFSILSCLIDGTFKNMPAMPEDDLPDNWNNGHLCITKDWEEVEKNVLSELSGNKEAKLMLVAAYGSFKAGANMQYEIPEGLDYAEGDNWKTEDGRMKKDWDAVCLQRPTAYLMMDYDSEEGFEKSLYNVMLTLMMLLERGYLAPNDVARWMFGALSGNFMFSEAQNPGVGKDKAAWAQTIVEQAVGRLCRTRNKPHTTYILFDESMVPCLSASNLDKSLTKEFRTLAEEILKLQVKETPPASPDEIIRCNEANYAQAQLRHIRSEALRYTLHAYDDDEYDSDPDDGEDIPFSVKRCQMMNQNYKQMIVRYPVITSLDELNGPESLLTFMPKCYGDWKRDEWGVYSYNFDASHNCICPAGRGVVRSISPSDVRLDVLMKNPVIKAHYEKNGFATAWRQDGLILHPQILAFDYAGEIGEEAFKAILLHYTDCTENDLKHLEDRDYELADFVVLNPDGTYRIAFDVKNMNPDFEHLDKSGDIDTAEKRRRKRERLGCELITVNMLQLNAHGMDEIREIGGVIDREGKILSSAIDILKKLVNH